MLIYFLIPAYTFLVLKMLLRIFMLLDSFHHAGRVTAWMVQMELERLHRSKWTLKIRKTIMAPKRLTYGMSTNLPRHAPKRKSANQGLEPCNDEVGIIEQSSDECMKDQYWFRNQYMKYIINNMFILIPCQQPSFSDMTINFKTASPRSLAYVTVPFFYNLTQPFY